jgi:hypothetical protein
MVRDCGCGGSGSTKALWQVTLPNGSKETYSSASEAENRAIATGGTYRKIS